MEWENRIFIPNRAMRDVIHNEDGFLNQTVP